jgi:hypothetical protein
MVAEIPPVTRRQVQALRTEEPIHAEFVSMLFGLALGMIFGFWIRDNIKR